MARSFLTKGIFGAEVWLRPELDAGRCSWLCTREIMESSPQQQVPRFLIRLCFAVHPSFQVAGRFDFQDIFRIFSWLGAWHQIQRCGRSLAISCFFNWEHVEPANKNDLFLRLTPAHFTFLMNKNETADAKLQKALEDALQYYEENSSCCSIQCYKLCAVGIGVEVICYWSPIDKGKRETQLGMLFTSHFWKHGGVFENWIYQIKSYLHPVTTWDFSTWSCIIHTVHTL